MEGHQESSDEDRRHAHDPFVGNKRAEELSGPAPKRRCAGARAPSSEPEPYSDEEDCASAASADCASADCASLASAASADCASADCASLASPVRTLSVSPHPERITVKVQLISPPSAPPLFLSNLSADTTVGGVKAVLAMSHDDSLIDGPAALEEAVAKAAAGADADADATSSSDEKAADEKSGPLYAGVPVFRQRLIYSGRMLNDGDVIGADGVQMKLGEVNYVHLVPLPPGARPSPAAARPRPRSPSAARVPNHAGQLAAAAVRARVRRNEARAMANVRAAPVSVRGEVGGPFLRRGGQAVAQRRAEGTQGGPSAALMQEHLLNVLVEDAMMGQRGLGNTTNNNQRGATTAQGGREPLPQFDEALLQQRHISEDVRDRVHQVAPAFYEHLINAAELDHRLVARTNSHPLSIATEPPAPQHHHNPALIMHHNSIVETNAANTRPTPAQTQSSNLHHHHQPREFILEDGTVGAFLPAGLGRYSTATAGVTRLATTHALLGGRRPDTASRALAVPGPAPASSAVGRLLSANPELEQLGHRLGAAVEHAAPRHRLPAPLEEPSRVGAPRYHMHSRSYRPAAALRPLTASSMPAQDPGPTDRPPGTGGAMWNRVDRANQVLETLYATLQERGASAPRPAPRCPELSLPSVPVGASEHDAAARVESVSHLLGQLRSLNAIIAVDSVSVGDVLAREAEAMRDAGARSSAGPLGELARRDRAGVQNEIHRLAGTLGLLSDLTAGLGQLLHGLVLGSHRGSVYFSDEPGGTAAAPAPVSVREENPPRLRAALGLPAGLLSAPSSNIHSFVRYNPAETGHDVAALRYHGHLHGTGYEVLHGAPTGHPQGVAEMTGRHAGLSETQFMRRNGGYHPSSSAGAEEGRQL